MVARIPFTLEQLQEAVAGNRSYKAVARQLGYRSGSASMVKRWIAENDISVTHFGGNGFHTGRSPNFTYTHEQLVEAVRESRTIADVCRRLGRHPSGGTNTLVRRQIELAGLDMSHFMTRSEFAAANYKSGYRKRTGERVLTIWPEGSNRPQAATLRRLMIAAGVAHECAGCGQPPEWQGNPLVLQVDHRNGSWLDNRLENLRFLCPNCHSQQPTTRNRARRYAAAVPR